MEERMDEPVVISGSEKQSQQPDGGTFIRAANFGQAKLRDERGAKVTDDSEHKDIFIAQPQDHGGTALTVIAGRNRTGKSHLLRGIEVALRVHNMKLGLNDPDYRAEPGASAASNVWVRPVDPSKPFAPHLFLQNITGMLPLFDMLPGARETRRKQPDYGFKSIRQDFIEDQLAKNPVFIERLQEDGVDGNPPNKERLTERLESNSLFRVSVEHLPVLNRFEQMCGARLYLRYNARMSGFHPFLRYPSGEVTPYGGATGGWSSGQKVAFVTLLAIQFLQPSILLVDELENHLHPEFMSKICGLLKDYVPQAIVVSHHPHLIFSTFVDRGWFFELPAQQELPPPPVVSVSPKNYVAPPPKRRIVDLNSDFDRVSAAYHLFDSFDKQLLSLSMSLRSEVALAVLHAVNTALTLRVVDARRTRRPDSQTVELADVLGELGFTEDNVEVRVLDYGAGTGRTFFEMMKIADFKARPIRWDFYEPGAHQAKKLVDRIAEEKLASVNVMTTLPASGGYDLILAVNLLHECTPEDIYKFFSQCRSLMSERGRVVVAELYPLLEPERFGIGYSSGDMLDIVDACGFQGYSRDIVMRGGTVSAYAFVAKPGASTSAPAAVEAIVDRVWKTMRRRYVLEYGNTIESPNVRHAVKLASQLHVLASMEAYQQGVWKPFQPMM
jgi:SAM-dependent methyltransferase